MIGWLGEIVSSSSSICGRVTGNSQWVIVLSQNRKYRAINFVIRVAAEVGVTCTHIYIYIKYEYVVDRRGVRRVEEIPPRAGVQKELLTAFGNVTYTYRNQARRLACILRLRRRRRNHFRHRKIWGRPWRLGNRTPASAVEKRYENLLRRTE